MSDSGSREILVAGRFGVEIEPSLDGVDLRWWSGRLDPLQAYRWVVGLLVGLVGTAVGGLSGLVWALSADSTAGLLALGVAVAAAVAALIGGSLWVGRPVPRALRITNAGVAVDGGDIVTVGPDAELHLVVHERGAPGRASEELVRGLAASDTPQARASGHRPSLCGVDLVVDGTTIPVARKVTPLAALAILAALRTRLPAERPALADTEALDALNEVRDGPARAARAATASPRTKEG